MSTTQTSSRSGRWPWARRLLIAYLVVLHLAIAIMLARVGLPMPVRIQLGLKPANTPSHQAMLFFQKSIDAQLPEGSTVFLGDSITQGLANMAVVPLSANYGISGQTTAQLLGALGNYGSLPRVKAIVLTIGINDFLRHEEVGIEQRLTQIVQALPPHVPLLWNAIMPVAPGLVDATALARTNLSIQGLCAQRPRCTYLDSWPVMSDGQGGIQPTYYIPDGVHLSAQGYLAWIKAMKHALTSAAH
ncbi:MAG: hypothetical protein HY836_08525 [Aquabacterium sp.]|uniref:GDSL-type esterase/lipase family protein n=1 Tax=Aquabacterium sp. TaxID=1872578 RepID=UPI0025C4408B|nr:GDSL-type esterase/lipase family protein [Aquabacterium sp.]MBI5925634.1 hypothetical protein [Aquabacterium sp.]